MGSAIVRGIVDKNILNPDNICLYDKIEEKSANLAGGTGCSQCDLSQTVRGSDVLLIAVKPQDFGSLAGDISADITRQLIISIMAGVTIEDITKSIGTEVPIVRAMPNLAAFVGEGMTCISCNSMVSMKEETKHIFSGIGKVLEVKESSMDAVTALSGNGPAYLFYLAQAMLEAGIEAGLDELTSGELVVQTLYGSAKFLAGSEDSAEELIKKVASRGGTTEAALSVFKEKDLKGIIKTAVIKAKERSQAMSEGKA